MQNKKCVAKAAHFSCFHQKGATMYAFNGVLLGIAP